MITVVNVNGFMHEHTVHGNFKDAVCLQCPTPRFTAFAQVGQQLITCAAKPNQFLMSTAQLIAQRAKVLNVYHRFLIEWIKVKQADGSELINWLYNMCIIAHKLLEFTHQNVQQGAFFLLIRFVNNECQC